MSLISSDGKIFNKINLIDFIIISFILVSLLLGGRAYFMMKYLLDQNNLPRHLSHLIVNIDKLSLELAGFIKVDDELIERNGKKVGVIKKILKNVSAKEIFFDDEQYRMISNPYFKDLTLIIEANIIEYEDGYYLLDGQSVRIGNNISIMTRKYLTSGLIIGSGDNE